MDNKHIKKVQNKNRVADILIYALSTCIWCKKTKGLLDTLEIEYSYIDMDTLDTDNKLKAKEELEYWNPSCSFPTVIINNNKCIVGFKEEEIKKELKI